MRIKTAPNGPTVEISDLPSLRDALAYLNYGSVPTLIDPRNGAGIITSSNPSAWGDGRHDDTTAINLCTAYARSNPDTVNDLWPYHLDFRSGQFLVSNVNMTLFRSRRAMTAWGGTFIGQGSSDALVDMSGTSFFNWFGPCVKGNGDSIGILLGRADINGVQPTAQANKLWGPQANGTFTKAAMFDYGSENFGVYGGSLINLDTGGSAYALAIDGFGTLAPSSKFVTVAPVGQAYSCMKHTISSTILQNQAGAAVYLGRTLHIEFQNCYGTAATSAFVLDFPDGFTQGHIYLDLHLEPIAGSDLDCYLKLTNGASNRKIADLRINENGSRFLTLLKRDGAGQITINGGVLNNSRIRTTDDGTPPAFVDDETKFLVRAVDFRSSLTTGLVPGNFISGSSGWTTYMDANPAQVPFTVA